MDQARVTFAGEDGGDRELVVGCRPPSTLLELSTGAGIPHYHECGGRARCSTCRVRVLSGDGLAPRTRFGVQVIEPKDFLLEIGE